jgi:hypothetical protein
MKKKIGFELHHVNLSFQLAFRGKAIYWLLAQLADRKSQILFN